MLGYIVLLWIIIQLKAPIWCFILIIGAMIIKVIDLIIKVVDKVLERRLAERIKEKEL